MAVGEGGERKVQIVLLSDPSAGKHCYSMRYFIVTKDKLLAKKDTHYLMLSNKAIITVQNSAIVTEIQLIVFFLSSDVIPGQTCILFTYFSI